ncbi:GNAT family N-acetyltransferase [Nocardioides sp. Kera G14]|uniref:GNAT family N-acetyltransferase n=1 Tax=Nocardioides sp. Kera G14 TaxID=2884264 RepID=UPI001D0F50EA|nr:GNAT family N-acetyltransferase [Nocardioides sp. Kera G14]UDY22339.1 GNAT family N-acetyltransferase [Nocardioides sp. Kera G14]
MEILSKAWQTDLALREASGSDVEDHGTCILVRTPANPTYHWGNFLLLRRTPVRRDIPAWIEVFREAFPEASHCAFGVDDPTGDLTDLRPFAEAGFTTEVTRAMTATSLRLTRRRTTNATFRQLKTDEDWERRIALSVLVDQDRFGNGFPEFVRRKAAAERALADSGAGDWFGAFVGDEMVAGLGIFSTGHGPARFQDVVTHPAWRRRGLASGLVVHAGDYAVTALRADSLVIVTEPDNPARRVYEAVGFVDREAQLQATLIR